MIETRYLVIIFIVLIIFYFLVFNFYALSEFKVISKTNNNLNVSNSTFITKDKWIKTFEIIPHYDKPTKSEIIWFDFISMKSQKPSIKINSKSFQSAKSTLIRCKNTVKPDYIDFNKSGDCMKPMDDRFIKSWQSKKITGLCEADAPSKITCYDSPNDSRYCSFENVMVR